MIYPNDHDPPHVHVWKSGVEARFYLNPVSLWNSDLKANETRQALKIVGENRDTRIEKWNEIHGTEDDNGDSFE